MKYLILTFFLISAALAAPLNSNEVIEDEIISHEVEIQEIEDKVVSTDEEIEDKAPVALPQIEEGVIEAKVEEAEDADAAFMQMMPYWNQMMMQQQMFNPMMSYGQMNPMGYGQNPMGYGQMSSYGYNPMMNMYNPMMGMGGGYPDMMGMGGGYPQMMDPMGGMGMYPPMGGMGMGGMDPMFGGMGMGGMDPMMNMYNPMMGMGGGYPDMMGMGGGYPDMMGMGGMGPMGGMGMNGMYPPMGMGGMDPMMGGMGGFDPMMMGGMGGYDQMDGLGYHHEEQINAGEELPFKNADFPIDYTLECSDHCACEQVCKFNYLNLCTCRCPPPCSNPNTGVKV